MEANLHDIEKKNVFPTFLAVCPCSDPAVILLYRYPVDYKLQLYPTRERMQP
jgi:hypothetical protein